MKEIWKPIKGYETLYKVSNLGNVKSIYYNRKGIEYLVAQDLRRGYLRVALIKNGIRKYYSVHRLVAEAFIPNPNNLPCINHKDENKQNNKMDNLEWCTHSYNKMYSAHKSIVQLAFDGTIIKKWNSIKDASITLSLPNSHITSVCKGYRNSCGGFKWKYMEDIYE